MTPIFLQSLRAKKLTFLAFKTKDDINTSIGHIHILSMGDIKVSAIHIFALRAIQKYQPCA